MAMDARKVARIRQETAGSLVTVQRQAVRHIKSVLAEDSAEGSAAWADSSVRTRVSLSLVQASLAAERAKDTAKTPVALGVIFMEKRLADTPANRLDWEAEARALNEARAIEAVAVEKKPDGT